MEGVSGIYRLIIGTFPIVDPARRQDGRANMKGSEDLLGALRRAGPDAETVALGKAPPCSLLNHARGPRSSPGRPLLLGHAGHPAGLSNGKPPDLPAREKTAGPAGAP